MVHVLPQLEERHQDHAALRCQAALPGGAAGPLRSFSDDIPLTSLLPSRRVILGTTAAGHERRAAPAIRSACQLKLDRSQSLTADALTRRFRWTGRSIVSLWLSYMASREQKSRLADSCFQFYAVT
jgi:hypothetical protein